MATLKEVKTKISAVKKTKQITKAMKMVATSKLRSSQMTMEAFRPYAEKFSEVLGNIADKTGEESNPLLTPKRKSLTRTLSC
jgi:F-type H+-transporting ATPase subunit gamma